MIYREKLADFHLQFEYINKDAIQSTIVDPDARLGYCATKKEVFLGYRVQLLILAENPGKSVGNLNADCGYHSPENDEGLAERGINNSTAQRASSPSQIPKKRRNQRKCIEGIIGIGEQCIGLEWTWVRGLENVKKDTLLKDIAMLFLVVVSGETGVEDMYLKPTFFFR